MKKDNGVYKYFDCSTMHISEKTNAYLQLTADLLVREHEYGYFIHVSEEIPTGIPTCLKAILKKAKKLDCQWVLLDCDGTEHDDLKKYNW
jgi:hypothetical protein